MFTKTTLDKRKKKWYHVGMRNEKEISAIYSAIRQAGGNPYMVGGSVRDMVVGTQPKDVDTEVFGIAYAPLVEVLSHFGSVNAVGVSFGVIKLRTPSGNEYDFSLPRRDSKTGKGHKGFMVEVDHSMTIADAAKRRDYTINAISIDVDGNVVDPYNGLDDLRTRTLRHTSEQFGEDPLRVLRGMQFAGRMDLTVTDETAAICRDLRTEYDTLAQERIWGEWEKWAAKSVVPSQGLEFLNATSWVYQYPELAALIGVPQEPEWHPEGSVWIHTKMVCDAAAAIAIREGLNATQRATLVFGALCHDLGKPATTVVNDSGRIVSPGHDREGVQPTITFMTSIGAPAAMIAEIAELTQYHMRHIGFEGGKAARRLANQMTATTPQMLGWIMEADYNGRPWTGEFTMPEDGFDFIASMTKAMTEAKEAIQPILMGRHLIEMGVKPGPKMGHILRLVQAAQVEGIVTDFEQAQAYARTLI